MYGRHRGSRYQLSEDQESASSYLSEGVVDNTLVPHDGSVAVHAVMPGECVVNHALREVG